MSIAALNWAFDREIKPSSLKFLLVAMCDYASEDLECFPSVETLTKKTGQNRKTVMANQKKLISLGAIYDSGHRRGSTRQIIVYKINMQSNIKQYQKRKSTKKGTVPEKAPLKSTKNGTSKEYQKRDTEPPVVNHQDNIELVQLETYCQENNLHVDCPVFLTYYQSKGWKTKTGKPVKNWKNLLRAWSKSRGKRIKQNVAATQESRLNTFWKIQKQPDGDTIIPQSNLEAEYSDIQYALQEYQNLPSVQPYAMTIKEEAKS